MADEVNPSKTSAPKTGVEENDDMPPPPPAVTPESDSTGRPKTSQSSSSGSDSRVNPFERWALRGLKGPIFSPNVFDMSSVSTPSSTSEFKGWDIHETAELFPQPIEHSPSSHTNPYPVDASTERKAQADIHEFFGRGRIAPTPEGAERKKPRADLEDLVGASGANTALSFPVGADLPPHLASLLTPYMTFAGECQSETISYSKRPGPIPFCSTSSEEEPQDDDDAADVFGVEEEEDMETSRATENGGGGAIATRKLKNLFVTARRRLELSFGASCQLTPIKKEGAFGGDMLSENHILYSPVHNLSPIRSPRRRGDLGYEENNTTGIGMDVDDPYTPDLIKSAITSASRGGSGCRRLFGTPEDITPIKPESRHQ